VFQKLLDSDQAKLGVSLSILTLFNDVESLQQLVLDTLNSSGNIPDTRDLIISGKSTPAASHDAQITILGALILYSRGVRPIAHYSNYLQSNATTSSDGKIHHA